MKYDCGALRKYPRQSEIFRYLTNDPPRSHGWPKHIQREFCIFAHTPGISNGWISRVFGFPEHTVWDMKVSLRGRWPKEATMGYENLITATYDDATRYCTRAGRMIPMPKWALPFFLEDVKNKIGEKELARRWGSTRWHMRKHSIF